MKKSERFFFDQSTDAQQFVLETNHPNKTVQTKSIFLNLVVFDSLEDVGELVRFKKTLAEAGVVLRQHHKHYKSFSQLK